MRYCIPFEGARGFNEGKENPGESEIFFTVPSRAASRHVPPLGRGFGYALRASLAVAYGAPSPRCARLHVWAGLSASIENH
jgi:hypothetical protein